MIWTNQPDCLPPAINWHFWPWCNYGCEFCFATFNDISHADRLKEEDAVRVPRLLAKEGAEKITFVGGEPTLCPFLGKLLMAAKDAGLTTCIVSNGTGISEEFLDEWNHLIDWVGLSIDASNDQIHCRIGRGLKRDLNTGHSRHLEQAKQVWENCRNHGIRMKLNTVVCKENLYDNMTELVLELRPERWKIFEVLPVKGQNDGKVDDLLLDEGEFETWLNRHSWVAEEGVPFVPESNDLMRGSYAMMDALGRFYTNVNGGHEYGSSILEMGVKEAWEQNHFLEERFHERGGLYEWEGCSNEILVEGSVLQRFVSSQKSGGSP